MSRTRFWLHLGAAALVIGFWWHLLDQLRQAAYSSAAAYQTAYHEASAVALERR